MVGLGSSHDNGDRPGYSLPTPEEWELSGKLGELAELEEQLASREVALATLEAELHVFQLHYLEAVRKRYAELDELEAEIAEIEAALDMGNAELVERAESARARAQETADALEDARQVVPQSRRPPSDHLKKLFRQVARVIHPDLADNDITRTQRERLMAAANRACASGDEAELEGILQEWEESPERVVGHGPAAELVRTIRQIARGRERLATIDEQVSELRAGELFLLRERMERSEAEGRDLLSEMAEALLPAIAASASPPTAVGSSPAAVRWRYCGRDETTVRSVSGTWRRENGSGDEWMPPSLCCPWTSPRAVYSVAVSPDGRFAAGGSGDRTVRLWRLPEL